MPKERDPNSIFSAPVVTYREAVKSWNESTFSDSLWGVPRKGYAPYNAIMKIREGKEPPTFTTIEDLKKKEAPLKFKKPPKERKPKEKKEKKSKGKKDEPAPEPEDEVHPPLLKEEPIVAKTPEEELFAFMKEFQANGSKIANDYVYRSGVWLELCLLHFLREYKNYCFIVFTHQKNLTYNLYLYNPESKARFDTMSVISDEVLVNIATTMTGCINDSGKDEFGSPREKPRLIIIPLVIPGTKDPQGNRHTHSNVLIYRVATNTIERFEPHGERTGISSGGWKDRGDVDEYNKRYDNIIRDAFETRIYGLNKKYDLDIKFPPGCKYIKPDVLAGAEKGFQSVEPEQAKKALKISDEEYSERFGGFCLMWSMFYLEMCLKYPTWDARKLNQHLFDFLKNEGERAFYDHIVGYTDYALSIIKKLSPKFKDLTMAEYKKEDYAYYDEFVKFIREQLATKKGHTIDTETGAIKDLKNIKGNTIIYKKVLYTDTEGNETKKELAEKTEEEWAELIKKDYGYGAYKYLMYRNKQETMNKLKEAVKQYQSWDIVNDRPPKSKRIAIYNILIKIIKDFKQKIEDEYGNEKYKYAREGGGMYLSTDRFLTWLEKEYPYPKYPKKGSYSRFKNWTDLFDATDVSNTIDWEDNTK